MDRLWSENKIPMLVGGTGLYIDSLIFERNATEVGSDLELRKQLDLLNNQELYQKLEEIDPEYAAELHPNNRPYVERGIEVMELTGKSKTVFRSEKKLLYDVLFLTPEGPTSSQPSPLEEKELAASIESGVSSLPQGRELSEGIV